MSIFSLQTPISKQITNYKPARIASPACRTRHTVRVRRTDSDVTASNRQNEAGGLQITKLSFVLFIAFVVSFTASYFATPTVFGGRDQGAIAIAAINFAKNKSFVFSTPVSEDLFQKYGPGKALNFPGFDYTRDGKLVIRFPKIYIIYLAGCYSLFGLKGIQFANFLPLFLFLLIFWLTLRQFFSEKISFFGFLITATFFPFLWFAKYTLTEIFMLFLVWLGIYFLIILRHPTSKPLDGTSVAAKPLHLRFPIIVLALSALVRIEGMIFFLLAVIYIILLSKKKRITLPKNFYQFLSIFVLFFFIIYSFLNFPALLDSLKNIAKVFLLSSARNSIPSANLYLHIGRIFFNYNILIYLILGLAGIGWLAKNIRRNWTKPEFLPVFILFPSFLYLISPMITLDDPWLLRRFVFALFPILIFYSIYFLSRYFKEKALIYAIFITLAVSNLAVTSRYITQSENKNLLPQVEKISQKFGGKDLILVDRLASGNGFSLLSEPLAALYGKQAVYFFNADDLKYINKNNYENIYLIAPVSPKNTWYADLIKNKPSDTTIIIENNYLKESSGLFSLAQNIDITTQNGIWKLNRLANEEQTKNE